MAEAEVKWKNLQAEVSALQRELQQAQAEVKQLLASAKAQPSPAQPEKPANDLKLIDTMSQKISKLEQDFTDFTDFKKRSADQNKEIAGKFSKLEQDVTDSKKRSADQNEKIATKLSIHDNRFLVVEQDISSLTKEVRSTAHLHRH